MFEAVNPGVNRVKRMGIAKMRRHRDTLVHILDDSPGRVGRHRKVDLDRVDASLQEAADFLGDRIDRWYTVEHSGERTAKALVGSVEQRTKHKEPRAELRAAVQIGPELEHLLQLAAHVAGSRHTGSEEQRQAFLIHHGGVHVSIDQTGQYGLS